MFPATDDDFKEYQFVFQGLYGVVSSVVIDIWPG